MTGENKQQMSLEGIETLPLQEYAESAYLNYSMSVIRDRALPAISDGMKPVQRRIVYAMARLGLGAGAKHVKSARTVGEVLGKYHPHGDSACYEAMVLMAQPFSYRYPLIDGQGNWGDAEDPKSFAAMRYTESRLAPYAEVLLEDLGSGCVDWQPNFDGTTEEPAMLPARLPNILLNGTTGIAVGMATDIPPHNLREVAAAAVYLLQHPEAGTDQLMEFIKGPDYPCGAMITTGPEELKQIYETGRGSIRQRAIYHTEPDGVVIDALPYQVSGGRIEEEVAALMLQKKIPQVADIVNASDHRNPCRIIIVPRSGRVNTDEMMEQLFARTSLEKSYRVNLNILGLDGRPAVKGLRTILTEWLTFRTECVRRKLRARLEAVERRLRLLDGLMVVFLNLDEVIRIIREDEKPKERLKERFGLTDEQVDYILETKLRQLARLEEMKLRGERDDLLKEQESLTATLGSETKLKGSIRREIERDAKKYGDDRRCEISARAAAVSVTPREAQGSGSPVTVILSQMGWVRCAAGHDIDPAALSYRSGDSFLTAARGRSTDMVSFITDLGRLYSVDAAELPSARGQGEPLTSKLNLQSGEKVLQMVVADSSRHYLLYTDRDYGFVISGADLQTRVRSGRVLINLTEGAVVLAPAVVANCETDLAVVVSRQGRLLCYRISEIPVMSHGKGVKLMGINTDKLSLNIDGLVAAAVVAPGSGVILHCGKRTLTLTAGDLQGRISSRTLAGYSLPVGFQRVDSIEIRAPQNADSPADGEDFELI